MRSENAIRPLSRTQRARREDIVAAAVAVLDRDGFAAASLDAIATEAGTTKGTVLYHYGSKQAVHQAVVEALYERGSAYMTTRIVAAEGHRARLHAYLDSNLRFIADNTAHVNAVHRIVEGAGGRVQDDVSVPALRAMLADGQADGVFGEFDPQVAALMIRAVVDGAAHYFTAHPELDIEHHIAEAIRLFDRATSGEASP
ncbi:TetR/AcrR family transcriptional regulator [Yinghuangia seranimata]|uniref:TetR/AcrR family transcriptional regulator n=1 Tax=Yinghuangia seranimata TaxID=408067 RepID=UPI00248C7EA9|nr:TetR/AcrR family transcriptional regulator [Yinghuangia seranimata]MDI2127823.1 TetR/AcrR family transcriptional regulator [Yinghuangia seranimata]